MDGMYGMREKCMQNFGGEPERKGNFEDLTIDGMKCYGGS
jgi:hypothetical protein